MELPGRRRRRRPKRSFLDVVREDMQMAGVTEEEAKRTVFARWQEGFLL